MLSKEESHIHLGRVPFFMCFVLHYYYKQVEIRVYQLRDATKLRRNTCRKFPNFTEHNGIVYSLLILFIVFPLITTITSAKRTDTQFLRYQAHKPQSQEVASSGGNPCLPIRNVSPLSTMSPCHVQQYKTRTAASLNSQTEMRQSPGSVQVARHSGHYNAYCYKRRLGKQDCAQMVPAHTSLFMQRSPVFVLAGLGVNKRNCSFFLCKSAIHLQYRVKKNSEITKIAREAKKEYQASKWKACA